MAEVEYNVTPVYKGQVFTLPVKIGIVKLKWNGTKSSCCIIKSIENDANSISFLYNGNIGAYGTSNNAALIVGCDSSGYLTITYNIEALITFSYKCI